jgi:putative ATP-binding cassette transporter
MLLVSAILASMAGVANVLLVASVNSAIDEFKTENNERLVHFIWLGGIYFLSRVGSMALLTHISQDIIAKLREKLARKFIGLDYAKVESWGAAKILTILTEDVRRVGECMSLFPALLVEVLTISGILIYVGWTDIKILGFFTAFVSVGAAIHLYMTSRSHALFESVREKSEMLFRKFEEVCFGNKELKLKKWLRSIHEVKTRKLATELKSLNKKAFLFSQVGIAWADILFFMMIASMILVFSYMPDIEKSDITSIAIATVYIMGPINFILNSTPEIVQGKISLDRILAGGIEEKVKESGAQELTSPRMKVKTFGLEGVTYDYADTADRKFTVGPIDVLFKSGEIAFIIGGNGSGKTTLVKILCLLYRPNSGSIRINDRFLSFDDALDYREDVSAIFSDFRLFKELLPDSHVSKESVHGLLNKFGLEDIIQISRNEFSDLNLSSGQKKRLALLSELFDDRQIMIFDEWASDQDPGYRKRFYEEFLPELKAMGKIVIVICHDESYFPTADRIIRMEYGIIQQEYKVVRQ